MMTAHNWLAHNYGNFVVLTEESKRTQSLMSEFGNVFFVRVTNCFSFEIEEKNHTTTSHEYGERVYAHGYH